MPSWVQEIFGSSSVILATLMAVVLNQMIPDERK